MKKRIRAVLLITCLSAIMAIPADASGNPRPHIGYGFVNTYAPPPGGPAGGYATVNIAGDAVALTCSLTDLQSVVSIAFDIVETYVLCEATSSSGHQIAAEATAGNIWGGSGPPGARTTPKVALWEDQQDPFFAEVCVGGYQRLMNARGGTIWYVTMPYRCSPVFI